MILALLNLIPFQIMCNKVVSKEPFILKHCLDRYKTQEIGVKAVDNFLPTLKLVPDWFVMNAVFSIDDIDLDDMDSVVVTFFSDGMGLITIDLNNINFDDDNFDKADSSNIVLVTLITYRCNRFKHHKACKKT